MRYRLLGPLEAFRDGTQVDLGTHKQRALLALLLINANEVVSTDRIIEELWGDDSGRDRQNTLWVNVSGLRAALEPDREKRTQGTILLTRAPGYVLSVDRADVDAAQFEQLALEGRSLLDPDPAAASLALSEALSLWRGHALEEFTYESFAQAEIARLEELRLATVEDRVSADLRVGRSRELIGELESLVRQHPLRERLTGHLMLALYRSGRQADALRAFGALQTRLGEELGIEPSSEIAKLEERIVLDDPALRQAEAALIAGGRPEPGLSVRGYELRDKIGEGALGFVYRAYQPAVGREVAIKVIRPELANDPEFIRRFEAEAQQVARLEHPQIVPLFDYWREPDSAFLVMRRFEQGSLQDALDAGPLSTYMAGRVLDQVGAALAAAHRKGVAHGDVKPSNILLDGDGNAYLADFGMSLGDGGPGTGMRSGTSLRAPYAAPEQLASGETSPHSDVFSFGVVAGEVLRGAIGDGELPDAPLVGPAADVIRRATAIEPAERQPDVEVFVAELNAVLTGGAVRSAPAVDVENPYRGLRAFDEGDADRFFGRERLIERLVARLGQSGRQGRFVALVGPSGAGKSSVVRAGLIPALRQGALPGSERWFVVVMTPGRHPFEALEDVLLKVAVDPPANLLDRIIADGIPKAVQTIIPDATSQLLLVVDQLEELFSQASPADAGAFLTALADAAHDRQGSVKVVATQRADFYDQPLRHEAFGELLRLGTEVITPMTAGELERAITAPATEVGVSFESGLVAQIVSDMSGQSAALPLMQYALTELFEERVGATITSDSYAKLGGVSGALARRAQSLYEGLDGEARAATRDVFLRLVSLGEGSEDTRRRALLSELTDTGGEGADAVLDTFGRHRLLSFDRDPITRSPTAEIAHEALLTEWRQLRNWVDEARSDIRAQRRLSAAAGEWRERDQDPDYLLAGARLGRYTGWVEQAPVRLTSEERQLLTASEEASEVERRAERFRVRRLRRLVMGIGVALVLALVAGALAVVQQRRADDEAELARARELAALSTGVLDDDPQLGILLGLEAVNSYRASGREIERAAVEALHHSILASRALAVSEFDFGGANPGEQSSGTPAISYSPDGRVLATGTGVGTIHLRDPVSGEVSSRLEGHQGSVVDLNWVDDQHIVTSSNDDGTIRLWDVASGEQVWMIEPEWWPWIVSMHPGGERLAAMFWTETSSGVVAVDVPSGREIWRQEGINLVAGVEYDPTGNLLAVTSWLPEQVGGGFYILDAESGEMRLYVPTDLGECDPRWSPDGARIVTAGTEGARVWDATDGRELVRFTRHNSPVCTADFSPDGTLVATGAEDGMARIWSASTGDEIFALAGHTERVGWVDFSPDGNLLATISSDGSIRTWDVATAGRGYVTVTDPGVLHEGAYSRDGGTFAIASSTGEVRVFDAKTGEEIATLPHAHPVYSLELSHDGSRLVSGTQGGIVTLWDVPGGHEMASLDVNAHVPFPGPVFTVDMSHSGELVAIGSSSWVMLLWDPRSESVRMLERRDLDQADVVFSPDDDRVALAGSATAGTDEIRIWDQESGAVDSRLSLGLTFAGANSAEFTTDGNGLLAAHTDGVVRIWDLESQQVDEQYVGHVGRVLHASFSPDESMIASVGVDGTVRWWDAETRELLLILEDDPSPSSASFSPDGEHLLVTGSQGAHVYLTDIDDLIDLAHSRLVRPWTPSECLQFLGTPDCPAGPSAFAAAATSSPSATSENSAESSAGPAETASAPGLVEAASLEIDVSGAAATASTRLPDFDGAVAGDDGSERRPLGTVPTPVSVDRLDFLVEQCLEQDLCFRDAMFVNPEDPSLKSGPWQAGRPFHVRHGFINESGRPLGDEYDVVLYVFPIDGNTSGPTSIYTSDYVLRGTADQCGPTYRTLTEPVTCEWFVHEFPAGLPVGRHALWAFWEAPCSAWLGYGFVDSCSDLNEVMALFASGVDSPWEPSEVNWERL